MTAESAEGIGGTDMFDEDIEIGDKSCPKCKRYTHWQRCSNCDDGFSGHDCGEDCCACLDPEPNVRCDACHGRGYHSWCPHCGWDLLEGRYLNNERKHDEGQPPP